MKENLADAKLNEKWLMKQLNGYGIENIKDVFYAGLDTSNNLYISRKNVQEETHGKYGIE
ncbi:hypothetical protein F8153_10425 [Alkaliphilus serpentinus]|uniref:YetF C-terminal domain-containing protein n=2 Tax=Alkaliphilus serpentinus TaxID=1482731 RepID=A0A833MDJ8_9FIRM|nr:hypothetical protein F8153_10425 [Alkaliphilus serpentinus]